MMTKSMLYFQRKIRNVVHSDMKTGKCKRLPVMDEGNRKVQMAARVSWKKGNR